MFNHMFHRLLSTTAQFVKYYVTFIIIISWISLFEISVSQYQPVQATSLSNIENFSLYSINENPYGITYGEWTAKWWQWAYSIPVSINPAYDNTGIHCSINQTSPTWFFPGTYAHDVTRSCTIPEGTSILFPILNSECSYAEFPSLKNESQLRDCAKGEQDKVYSLKASIDGNKLENLNQYRMQSPLFNFTLPSENILHLNPQITQGVSDGNWVFVKPLSIGKHKISFKGETIDYQENKNGSFAVPSGWNYNTTYLLTVR